MERRKKKCVCVLLLFFFFLSFLSLSASCTQRTASHLAARRHSTESVLIFIPRMDGSMCRHLLQVQTIYYTSNELKWFSIIIHLPGNVGRARNQHISLSLRVAFPHCGAVLCLYIFIASAMRIHLLHTLFFIIYCVYALNRDEVVSCGREGQMR